jgi:hypothetical protein
MIGFDISASLAQSDTSALDAILQQILRQALKHQGDVLNAYFINATTKAQSPLTPSIVLPAAPPAPQDERLEKRYRQKVERTAEKYRLKACRNLRTAMTQTPALAPYTNLYATLFWVAGASQPLTDLFLFTDLKQDDGKIDLSKGFANVNQAEQTARKHAQAFRQESGLSPRLLQNVRITFILPPVRNLYQSAPEASYLEAYWRTFLHDFGCPPQNIHFQPLTH